MKKGQLITLLDQLYDLGLEPKVQKNTQYNDEPRQKSFSTNFKTNKKYSDGKVNSSDLHGSGVSYFDEESAVMKSIWEAMERFCNYSFKRKSIIKKIPKNNESFLNLSYFSKDPQVKSSKFGWVKGVEVFTNKNKLIPAQFVYLNYQRLKNEPHLDFPHNTNGSAGGASHEMALLNGIYELIERDSLMGVYLNKISPPIVNLSAIKDKRIKYILDLYHKFNLDLYVLDATTDLGIPSFLSVAIDRTGLGPAISLGGKAGFKSVDAIIASAGETLMTRLYTKNMLIQGKISFDFKTADGLFPNRAKYWISSSSLKNIEFLIAGRRVDYQAQKFNLKIKSELAKVLKKLKKLGYKVYYVDSTVDEFRKLNFLSYYVMIPGLNPLYLIEHEKEKVVNIERLKKVANFFGKKFDGLNPIPHPFL